MHMDVNTAKSFAVARLFATRPFTTPRDAPADPRAVIGTAIDSLKVNPNSGFRMKDNLLPIHGRRGTPSLIAPV